jgi:hypothetical protein
MNGVLPAELAIHIAVLADVDRARTTTITAVLAYDERGRRHLHPIAADVSAEQLIRLLAGTGSGQLRLPIIDGLPAPTSSGMRWRTWVLPTVPTSMRTLPPERLAAAVAQQLLTGVAS